jgi:hypothetical protein
MKRIKAGSYQLKNYYAVRLESGWWSVGYNQPWGSDHIDDFKTLKQARSYILRQEAK